MLADKEKYKHIKGWGIDADPENEPTYPMKNYTGDDHTRINWDRPPLQRPAVEVLRSIERPTYSAVVGETLPPKGLSGIIRRYAFQFSESQYGHWLPLLLADRINEWEGIVTDLSQGKIPNVFAEKGGRAAWKYNRPAMLQKTALTAVATIAVLVLWQFKKRNKYR